MDGRLSTAVSDFQRARRRAALQNLMARLTGRAEPALLSFEDVRRMLHTKNMIERGLHNIPLDAIVGSVGRYKDFNRSFLPLHDSDQERWARVKVAQTTQGTPPIEVYKIGDAYFVLDGNHRVSIARELGNETIEAFVTEVQTRVKLSPDDSPDDLIMKAEYAHFLAQTELDELRPEADLRLTAPGKYPELLEHIEVHRYFMGINQSREVPYTEAVTNWYDTVYAPSAELIHSMGLLNSFPERTIADLYLWLSRHRADVERELGWKVDTAQAAIDLVEQIEQYEPVFDISGLLRPVTSTPTPSADQLRRNWRRDRALTLRDGKLVSILLLPIRGQDVDWRALDQAIEVARREGSIIKGLYAVDNEDAVATLAIQSLAATFRSRCEAAGVTGELIVEVGAIDELATQRARWVDLTILRLTPENLADNERRLNHYPALLSQMPSPVLIVSTMVSPFSHALLALDGTHRTEAAVFAAAHLAAHWDMPLSLVTLGDSADTPGTTGAIEYLEREGVRLASRHQPAGSTAETIEAAARASAADLIIMGEEAYAKTARLSDAPVLVIR